MVAISGCGGVAAAVVQFAGYLSARDYDPLPALFGSNATWWTAGNPSLTGDSGGTADAVLHITVLETAKVYDFYSFTIKNQVTEINKSIIEAQIVGDIYPDLHYVNNITMAFTLDVNDKITLIREYDDRIEINYLLQWFEDHNVTTS